MHATPHSASHGHDDVHAPGAQAPLDVLLVAVGTPIPDGVRVLLRQSEGVRVIERPAATRRPDVVLLSVDARDRRAEATVREVCEAWRDVPVLVLTPSEDRARNRRLVLAGARGIVPHARQHEHLVTALRRVREREIWLSRSCMAALIDEVVAANHPVPEHLATPHGLERLTEREREVVALIARGMHNKAIAAELGITDHTVRHHLTAIFAKLGVADRLELAVYAFRHHRPSATAR